MGKLERTDRPQDLDLDPQRLRRAERLLSDWTRHRELPMPGAALLIGRGDRYLTPRFFGCQGPTADAPPIREDGIFSIASVTKPVVYLAAMQLVEEGRLGLYDKVVRYVPEFAANHKDQTRVIHLMTHTSGLPDMLPENVRLRQTQAPMERFLRGALEVAPLFEPGTDFSYQSMGTLVMAEIVRRLSGRSLRDYLREHIFEPLGMSDSALGSEGLPAERLVAVETATGTRAKSWDWNSDYWHRFGAPWGGMFSSPEDFARLCHSLLAGPQTPVSILGPRALEAMTTNQLAGMPGLPEAVRRSHHWGLGWQLNSPPGAGTRFCDLLGPHVYGHTGATGCMVWLDPKTKLFCILFTTGVRAKAPWRQIMISNVVASAMRQ